jgi:hypothetical protein
MAQANNQDSTMSSNPSHGIARRGFIAGAALAIPAVAIAPTALLASSDADPIFAAINAYMKARDVFNSAADEHVLAERELHAAGDLFPRTASKGNPHSGLRGPVFSRTHKEIDQYTPVAWFPTENAREHAELSAAEARRDARITPLEQAKDAAWDAEREALGELVVTVPTTMPGVMAMLEFHRGWLGRDDEIEVEYLSCLVESVQQALEEMQTA